MTNKDKKLLVQDLAARLPYAVRCQWKNWTHSIGITSIAFDPKYPNDVCINNHIYANELHLLKPYLRPMSSMTEVEQEKVRLFLQTVTDVNYGDWFSPLAWRSMTEFDTFCSSRHLDHNGLIDKGLAIAVTEENNPYK